MLAFVNGKVFAVEDDALIIEAGGFGLTVQTPLAMMRPLPRLGESVMLYTYLQVREDAWTLFGFLEREQLEVFKLLFSVSGIGAKTALSVINAMPAAAVAAAVRQGDAERFCAVPGIGKKTAQRLLLELKDKFGKPQEGETAAASPVSLINNDLLAVLAQLGYGGSEARALAISAAEKCGPGASDSALIREALRLAAK
ncbi:MAG: Holliday junction branch migration protein RuvA [Clostridiales bacterium]|nr:Holliday junction branch migration protein RuvA [Clostridiales bacterium]